MPCKYLWYQVNQAESAIRQLKPWIEIPGVSSVTRELYQIRARLLQNIGITPVRTLSALLKIAGLSPGELTLWYDAEGGWMVEARSAPGAMPVYRYVDTDVAVRVLSGELTHEEFEALKKTDEYLGE